jgi:hypothetical protein
VRLRRIFVVWTCFVLVGWFLVWTTVTEGSSSCEASGSWICIDSRAVAGVLAIYAFVLWLLGILVVAVGIGLVRMFRRVVSDYDRA